MGISGNEYFVAVRLFFAPPFEVGWTREERRVVRVTRTTLLYHTLIEIASEISARVAC
jgi:hypothetical protein